MHLKAIPTSFGKACSALLVAGIFSIATITEVAAQTSTLYNTISGKVWNDANEDGIRQINESPVEGVMVSLLRSSDEKIISSDITDANGAFTMNNFEGTGNYFITYSFPFEGFETGSMRIGSDQTLNSAADPETAGELADNVVSTPPFIISDNSNLDNYGLALIRDPFTLIYFTSKQFSITDWNENFSIPKWLNKTDTNLLSVTLFLNAAGHHPEIKMQNTSTSSVQNPIITPTSKITSVPSISTAEISSIDLTHSLPIYDGSSVYYTTSSSYIWENIYSTRIGSRTYSSTSSKLPYRSNSSETFSVTVTADGQYGASGAGNTSVQVATDAAVGLFVIYRSDVPLPLTLQSFTAKAENSSALINWTATSDGTPNEFFAVEHSIDGKTFSEIGTVNANWESKTPEKYQFRHLMPATGKNFYRLRLHEASGKTEYSNVATVTMGKSAGNVSVFPNPANSELHIDGATSLSGIKLYNSTGAPVQLSISNNGDRATIQTSQLPAGIYFLQLTGTDGTVSSQRILIQHP